ncbi:MAG TPA: glycosyltransferase family 4 protein [Actinopolymorphaceae bacterium]
MGFAVRLGTSLVAVARVVLPARVRRRARRLHHRLFARRTPTAPRPHDRARSFFAQGRYDEALAALEETWTRTPPDLDSLELAARINAKQGALSLAGLHAVRRTQRTRDAGHWWFARGIVGRARETDPRWEPRITGPRPPRTATGRTGEAGAGRVLYLAKESRPFLHNGFCTRSHETLRALATSGRDVLGVTMPGFPGVLGVENAPDESVVEGITYRHLLPNAGTRLKRLAHDENVELAARLLAGLVAAERPALLHVPSGHRGFETALVGNAVAAWAGIPWLYEVRSFFEATWTDDARYAERGEHYERRFDTETRMMRAAGLVVTLSGPMRAEIVQRHDIPEDMVRVIPNAVDLTRFRPCERDPVLRRRLGLDGTFTLGYISNLSHPREGQEVLIRAVARLRARGREVSALIVGDGQRRPELERLAERLRVTPHVVFTGNVPFDQIAGHYAQIDLFVVPRIDERAARMVSPIKPFEAMAMRIPLLVADLPALVEIVDGTRRGHTFRAGDATALADAAARLMDDAAERAHLAEQAATWVTAERSWSSVARAFGDVYDELLDSTRRLGDLARGTFTRPITLGETVGSTEAC